MFSKEELVGLHATDLHDTVRAHVWVSGCVQGVGYRAFTCLQADFHRVSGWVRNGEDGRVEVDVQGSRIALGHFLGDLHRGPRFSSVDNVDVHWMEPEIREVGFEVLY